MKIQDGESNMADEKNQQNFLFIILAWHFLFGGFRVSDNRSDVRFWIQYGGWLKFAKFAKLFIILDWNISLGGFGVAKNESQTWLW